MAVSSRVPGVCLDNPAARSEVVFVVLEHIRPALSGGIGLLSLAGACGRGLIDGRRSSRSSILADFSRAGSLVLLASGGGGSLRPSLAV